MRTTALLLILHFALFALAGADDGAWRAFGRGGGRAAPSLRFRYDPSGAGGEVWHEYGYRHDREIFQRRLLGVSGQGGRVEFTNGVAEDVAEDRGDAKNDTGAPTVAEMETNAAVIAGIATALDAAIPAALPESGGGCRTLLEVVESHPNLTALAAAMSDLPVVRAALDDLGATDTFFAPTNAAIESFTRWSGFNDTRAALKELLGDTEWKGYIVAYHAVPNRTLTYDDLCTLKGDDAYLEDALLAEMPLLVDFTNASAGLLVHGLGSTARVVGGQLVACNGVCHMIDRVLLPFDGDGKLSKEQKLRLAGAKRALEARYPDRPTTIDPDHHPDEDGHRSREVEEEEV